MASTAKPVPETSQVGDYIVEYEIGRGSFATVYKGYHRVRRGAAPVTCRNCERQEGLETRAAYQRTLSTAMYR